jgi:hypothetical protein
VRYVVLAALMLLAMLTMTNTWAIQTDSVTQGGTSVVVTTTDTAMLALEPGSTLKSNAAGTAYLQDGKLMLDFSRHSGYPSTSYGFNSSQVATSLDTVKYKGLFYITNNSDESLCLRVYVPEANADDISAIYIRDWNDTTTNGTQVATGKGAELLPAATNCKRVAGGVATKVQVDFWLTLRSSAAASPGSYNFNVRVEGKR